MIDLLQKLGLPISLVALVFIFLVISIELWKIIKEMRLKNAEFVFNKIISELDDKINKFYLPLKVRLIISKSIFNLSQKFGEGHNYDNTVLKIKSDDIEALRNIFVRRIFLPLNQEIETLIKSEIQYKDQDDHTNYNKLLEHFMLWRALEEAYKCNEIDRFDASDFLTFPEDEVDNFYKAFDTIINRQKEIRNKVLKLQNVYNYILN